jgi:hypothetical protein
MVESFVRAPRRASWTAGREALRRRIQAKPLLSGDYLNRKSVNKLPFV